MELPERFALILSAMERACSEAHRAPSEITLIAISKRQPIEAVRALADLGHRDFGENLIQSWQRRVQDLPDAALRWHLVGGVQTNKAKVVARQPPALLHTVDRPELVVALERRLRDDSSLEVLIQVNMDEEPQKWGCAPGQLDALTDQIVGCPELRLRGLMCIPRPVPGGAPRAAFARTRGLLETISDRIPGSPVLSMGMSADFEAAITEGSTMIRVGTALFGPRTA